VAASLDRRQFLSRSLVAGAGLATVGGASGLLAACSSSSKSTTTGTTAGTSGATDLGSAKFQLSWVEDVEFAGEYIAVTNNYWKTLGLDVSLLAGGGSVNQDSVVASGKALVCISSPDITAPKILQGADLITIAAQYQKNPFCITSLASNPLPNPQAMVGKKIGVQPTNLSAWNSFLKANNLTSGTGSGQVNTIGNETFDPTPLVDQKVDGWFSFITNEPIEIAAQGHPVTTFLLNDYNYPLVSQTIVTQTSSLTSHRDELKALLKGDLMGWRASLKDPTTGAELAVNTFGKSQKLSMDTQVAQSKAQNLLILDSRTQTEGIFTVPANMQADTVKTLALGGTNISAAKLFDMSLLTEVYEENPDLKTDPTA
jgi:ABC-type nitrate/sulfonate/bicarbonate transport system substrate-binding protein